MGVVPSEQANQLTRQLMAKHFTNFNYHLTSRVKFSMAKKIHPGMGGWFLEAYSVMMNFHAKVTNSIANGTNSIAKTCNNTLAYLQ